jgi:muramidase (phage lysozyme)
MSNSFSLAKPRIRFGLLIIWAFLFFSFVITAFADKNDAKNVRKSEKPVSATKKTPKSETGISKRKDLSGKTNTNQAVNNSAKLTEKAYASMSSAAINKKYLLDKTIAKMTEPERIRVRRELEILLTRKSTQQFLTIIQIAEGGEPNIMVGDKPGCRVSNLQKHPANVLPSRCFYYYYDKKGNLVFSTAAGNYQITRSNYRKFAPFLNIKDFEVDSQQLIALAIVRDGGRMPKQGKEGFRNLAKGNVRGAIKKGTSDWAGVPGSDLPGRKYVKFKQMQEAVINGTYGKLLKNTAKNKKVKAKGNVQKTLIAKRTK